MERVKEYASLEENWDFKLSQKFKRWEQLLLQSWKKIIVPLHNILFSRSYPRKYLIFHILFSFQSWTFVVLVWRQNCAGLSWDPNMYFKNVWKMHTKLEILLPCEFSKWLLCQVNSDDPGWEPLPPSFRAEHLQVVPSEMGRVKVKPQFIMTKNVSLFLWLFLSWKSRLKISC